METIARTLERVRKRGREKDTQIYTHRGGNRPGVTVVLSTNSVGGWIDVCFCTCYVKLEEFLAAMRTESRDGYMKSYPLSHGRRNRGYDT
jgi:hypothetical protein